MNIDPSYLPVLDLLGKGSVVLLMAFGIHSAWRGASAAQRSLAWLAAFAVLAVLPASLLVNPRWELKVTQTPSQAPSLPNNLAPSVPSHEIVPVAPASPALPWWQVLSAAEWGLAVWAVGALLVLAFRGLGGWQLHRLRQTSSLCEDRRLHHHLDWLTEELEVARAIEVRQSAHTSVPLTWGWLKPVLLMPIEALTWDDEALDAALRHELGHIRHRDACTRWLATLVCALWWPVPLVWMAFRAWRIEQEKACDDLVLRAGAEPQDYAMQLLNAARSLAPRAFAAMAMARPSTLETRLRAVMDEQRNRRPMTARTWAIACAGAFMAGSVCVLAQLRAAEPASKGETIQLTTEIIEAPKGTLTSLLKASLAPRSASTLIDEQEWLALRPRLNQVRGVNVLSAPSVTTHSNIPATIEVGPEETTGDSNGKPSAQYIKVTLDPLLNTSGLHLNFKMHLRQPNGTKQGKTVYHEADAQASADMAKGKALVVPSLSAANPDRELFCIVRQTIHPVPATKVAEAPIGPAEAKAGQIILKSLVLRAASPKEAFDYLRIKARDLDPAKIGLNIVVTDPFPSTAISLDLHEVPLKEALLYCAELSQMEVSYAPDMVIIHKHGGQPQPVLKESELITRAKARILPFVEIRDATVGEAIEGLRVKGNDLDHPSLNIVLKTGNVSPSAKITLSLKNVPMFEALTYVAELADMKLEASNNAFVLSPKTPAAKTAPAPKGAFPEAKLTEAVNQLLPAKGVHIKSCEVKDGRLIIVGEAANQALAGALRQDLKRAPALAGYQWDFPPPLVKPYGFVSFRAEGIPIAK